MHQQAQRVMAGVQTKRAPGGDRGQTKRSIRELCQDEALWIGCCLSTGMPSGSMRFERPRFSSNRFSTQVAMTFSPRAAQDECCAGRDGRVGHRMATPTTAWTDPPLYWLLTRVKNMQDLKIPRLEVSLLEERGPPRDCATRIQRHARRKLVSGERGLAGEARVGYRLRRSANRGQNAGTNLRLELQ